jgi:metal-responsive CopG/Arc/MetJ family transcriptional regulator
MDFIVGLSKYGNKSIIMVVVDHLSRYAHLCTLPHPFTPTLVAQVFLHHIFKLHVMLTSIVFDGDPTFIRTFWKEIFKLHGTQMNMRTTYHP